MLKTLSIDKYTGKEDDSHGKLWIQRSLDQLRYNSVDDQQAAHLKCSSLNLSRDDFLVLLVEIVIERWTVVSTITENRVRNDQLSISGRIAEGT